MSQTYKTDMDMENKNFRARVMKYAWQIWKVTKQTWSVCMIKAWQLYKLSKAMHESVVRFTYLKTDGSVRSAIGTMKNMSFNTLFGGKAKSPYRTLAYFDIDKGGFRCFRVENLISVG